MTSRSAFLAAFAGGLFLAAASIVAAQSTTYELQDQFNDGSSTDVNPPSSGAWYASGGLVFTNGTGGANGTLALDNTTSRTLVGYFTSAATSPVTLGTGQTLRLNLTLSIDSAAVSKSSGLVVGLLQSATNSASTVDATNGYPVIGPRVSGNFNSSNPASGVFSVYTGYSAWTDLSGLSSTKPIKLEKRTGDAAGLDNSSSLWTAVGATGGPETGPATGTSFNAILALTRNSDGSITEAYTVTQGGSTLASLTQSDTAGSYTTFDTVNVYLASGQLPTTGHLTIQEADVTLTDPNGASAPTILTQPASVSANAGSNVTFSVSAGGAAPLAYQWAFDGSAIAGATGSSLALTGVGTGAAGTYTVLVSNSLGSTPSNAATLTLNVPPSVTTQPASVTVTAGSATSFSVVAGGTAPLSYQWSLNGSALTGATSSAYSIANAQPAAAGSYAVLVTNGAGSILSGSATLTVNVAPLITGQPAGQSVTVGTTATFAVTATGTAPLSYQWSLGSTAIAGATSSTYTDASAQFGDAGSYSVTVTSPYGSATSAAALLTVTGLPNAPVITALPSPQTVAPGTSVSFSAAGVSPLSYQWYVNGTPIPGATGAALTLPSVQTTDGGDYTVAVTNAAGSVVSQVANLAVSFTASSPSIVTQPVSGSALSGGTYNLQVAATGTDPLAYQWSFNGSAIAGATSSTLVLSNVQSSNTGNYTVVVSNTAGSATSSPAAISVAAALANSEFDIAGFATVGAGCTGGGIVTVGTPGYVQVYTATDLANALNNKTGTIKVIEIMNDLDLGYNEIEATAKAGSEPFRADTAPLLHPVLLQTGVSLVDIQEKNGLTIFSANGSTIRHAHLNVKDDSNIIIRNLKFDQTWEWDEATKGSYDRNNWDFITLGDGSPAVNVWIDHCTFTKAYDGVVDIVHGSYNITLSWCKYQGDDGYTNRNSWVYQQLDALEANKSAYPMYNFLRTNGFSEDDIFSIIQGHDKTHLIGSNDLDPTNAVHTVTLHHEWFINPGDRLPRLRAGNVHDYNIYVDDTQAIVANRMRTARIAAMSAANQVLINGSSTKTATYDFNNFLNGSISTEGGAMLVEKSVYIDCLYPLRNNQTDPSNPVYTGKVLATDCIYHMDNTDGSVTQIRGNSTDAGSPMGPFEAPIIPFSWNLTNNQLPYTYTMDDPSQLGAIVQAGAGAGVLTWDKSNWLKTSY